MLARTQKFTVQSKSNGVVNQLIRIFESNAYGHSTVMTMITRARKIVTKFHNYSYEIVMSPVIVNSYKNGHNSYQIVK